MKMITRTNSHPMSKMGEEEDYKSKHGSSIGGGWLYGSEVSFFRSCSKSTGLEGSRTRVRPYLSCSFHALPGTAPF
ncbi:MAG: hypothetical protein HOG49_28465 [Candidatus Scalindua sp.]|jgi:hypothetical protein|nr:hypothetical protein [Candidatus Scalindua sp.]